jgi:hypothetical protein
MKASKIAARIQQYMEKSPLPGSGLRTSFYFCIAPSIDNRHTEER